MGQKRQGTAFYPELDLLGPIEQIEPKPMVMRPPQYEAKPQRWKVGEMQEPGPQPVTPQAANAKKRGGWIHAWL
ncbi:hypothetical protein XI03_20710 [Bradyrhizobium sp. CCBAU 65884]|nr:hypothetical protein [Bradyrhizobium sp. CCBAU 65884]